MSHSFIDELIPLGETGDYINGIGFKESDWQGAGLPIIRIQNLTNEDKPFNLTSREVDEKYHVKNGDILVSWSATLDAFVWRRGPALLNQHIFRVIPREDSVDRQFLYYQLKHIIHSMSHGEHAHGSTMKHINRKPFLAHPFWRPSLEKQVEIGQWLDQHFSGLDDTERTLKSIQAKLKQARASILKAAVEGRLVETEAEPNSIPSRDETTQLPSGWRRSTLGALFSIHIGATPKRHDPSLWGGDIPWVSSGEIQFNRITKTKETITATGLEKTSTELHPKGTVLLAMIGQGRTRGQAAILEIDACTNQNCAAIRMNDSGCNSKYVYWWLYYRYDQTRQLGGGNNQKALNKKRVSEMLIPVPPPPEQDRIVEEIERRFSVLDQVEATVNTSLRRCGQLRQAVLKRAFGG